VNKKWPNDPKVGCKPPFNLIEFLKKDIEKRVGKISR
jgi:hypothetical protein